MRRDGWIRRLRHVKMRLAGGGALSRLAVPLVEVAEFSLSHGLREVLSRSRLRLTGKTTPPGAPALAMKPWVPPSVDLVFASAVEPVLASIVIPVMNNPALTRDCLRSIAANTRAGAYEVIVVDNASEEPTRQRLAGVPGLRTIRNEANEGFVGACNQGAAAARGEYIVFLNNDKVVLPAWLEALCATFAQNDRVGAAGAKLVYPNERLQEAGGIIWSDGDGWNYGRNEDPNAPAFNYVREVDYCSGACLMSGYTVYAPAYQQ
jgi:hypothetical protein